MAIKNQSIMEIRNKELTRERIMESAVQAFGEQGYHDTSMDDIVRRSGFSKGAIYFHFPGKEALFSALVGRLADALEDAARDSIDRERGALARVDAALQTLLGMIARHPGLARVVLVSGAGLGPAVDSHLIKLHERFARFIKEYLDKAARDGSIAPVETEVVAHAWLGAIKEIVTRRLRARDPVPLERVIPELRALLLRSIGIEIS